MTTMTMTATTETSRLDSILRNQKSLRIRFAATSILFTTGFVAALVAFFQAAA
jgi:hypothetical protein